MICFIVFSIGSYYDIEFKQNDRKFEADIRENGVYKDYEREIAAKDLPENVKAAIEKKYPKSTLKEVHEIIAVEGKNETLSGHEVILETADKKEFELTVTIEVKIAEEPLGKK